MSINTGSASGNCAAQAPFNENSIMDNLDRLHNMIDELSQTVITLSCNVGPLLVDGHCPSEQSPCSEVEKSSSEAVLRIRRAADKTEDINRAVHSLMGRLTV